MNSKETLTLHFRKNEFAILFIVSLLLVSSGYWMSTHNYFVRGILVSLIFAITGSVALIVLLTKTYIRLTSRGLEIVSVFKKRLLKWNEIQNFYVSDIGKRKLVLISYAESYKSEPWYKEPFPVVGLINGIVHVN